jgi:predicted dehydrogenase
MNPVRIGVIGCGNIARGLHLPVIAALSDYLELVAVCDQNESLARETAATYGVAHCTRAEDLLAQDLAVCDLEAVAILTYASNHHGVGRMAAQAGKHMVVEKPIAITLPCADVLLRACEQAGVLLQVMENYPFMPDDALVNRLARSGALGEIAAVYVCDDLNGMSLDIGVHRFAQVRAPVAAEPRRVTADLRRSPFGRPEPEVNERSFGDPLSDYWGRALVEFANGALGVCECFPLGRAAPVWAPDYRRVLGTEGVLTDSLWPNIFPPLPSGEVHLHRWERGSWREIPIERITAQGALEQLVARTHPPVIWENPFRDCRFRSLGVEWASPASLEMWLIAEAELYAGFARAIREGAALPYPGALGRLDLEMCIATYESARRGGPVDLPLREITPHEEAIHQAYRERYGRDAP